MFIFVVIDKRLRLDAIPLGEKSRHLAHVETPARGVNATLVQFESNFDFVISARSNPPTALPKVAGKGATRKPGDSQREFRRWLEVFSDRMYR